jgi:hypothetical protein
MKSSFARRLGASAMVVGVSALVVGASSAPAGVQGQGPPAITGKSVGAVKIGSSYKVLRKKGLVGKIRHGCELGGPNTRSAKLKSPLKGSVDFTLKNPRKVTTIDIAGGNAQTAKGLGIGATIDEVTAAYPHAKVDHGSDEVFEATFVTVPKSDGGKFQFAVSTKSGKTTEIGVPNLSLCE